MNLSTIALLNLCGTLITTNSFQFNPNIKKNHQLNANLLKLSSSQFNSPFSESINDPENFFASISEKAQDLQSNQIERLVSSKLLTSKSDNLLDQNLEDLTSKRKKNIFDSEKVLRIYEKGKLDENKLILSAYFTLKEIDYTVAPLVSALMMYPSLLEDLINMKQNNEQLPNLSTLSYSPDIEKTFFKKSYHRNLGLVRFQEKINNLENYSRNDVVLDFIIDHDLLNLSKRLFEIKKKLQDKTIDNADNKLIEDNFWTLVQSLVYSKFQTQTNELFKNTLTRFYRELKTTPLLKHENNPEDMMSLNTDDEVERLHKMFQKEETLQHKQYNSILEWLLTNKKVILPPWS